MFKKEGQELVQLSIAFFDIMETTMTAVKATKVKTGIVEMKMM